MRKQYRILLFVCCCALASCAQNWTAVTSSNLTDLNQQKLAAGSLCFLGTDQNDFPISFNIGGGGQVLARPFCVGVSNGASAGLSVPNPANTSPTGIYYRVTVTDSSTGQIVLRYPLVTFTGANFNLDNYAPTNVGSWIAPSGQNITGNLTVNGNIIATGTINGGTSNPALTPSTYSAFNSGAGYASLGAATDKQRGAFIQNYLQTHWLPISPWLNLDNFTKGDAVYLNAACNFTASSYTVTCASASFAAGDVGKLVVLFGARANGSGAAATTTLSGGALTTPTVTNAGSGYLTAPSVSVTGLTCTYVPELKAVLSGSNYQTGNTISSITVVYPGSGCTGTPSIGITAGPNLALAGSIASVTNATTMVLTTNVAPSANGTSQSMLYGSDDTANLNSALQALAPNSDKGLNPLPVYCGRLYMTSAAVQVINKSLMLLSPGPGNLSSGASQQGCAIFLANQSYTSPTDALYVAGTQFAHIRGLHIFGVSGNKQRAAVRTQQPTDGSTNHNNQYNRYEDNIIGPWYTGGANGNDPEASACFTGSFILNQCAQFQYGYFFDQPNGNNDQMIFTNDMVVGTDVGLYQYAPQSSELLLDRFMCDGCARGLQLLSNTVLRDVDISNSSDCDVVLGDAAWSGTNLGIAIDIQNFTDEGGHRFLCGDAQTSAVNLTSVFLHGQVSFQVGSQTIKSGTIIDFSLQNFGPVLQIVGDKDFGPTLLGTLPPTTAPINYLWFPGGAAQAPSLVQNGPNLTGNVNSVPLSKFTNHQVTYADFRQSQWFKRDWFIGTSAGQRCHTDMIRFGGDPDAIECNNTTILGKNRVFGELLVNAIGASATTFCSVMAGSGSTTYYYKMAGVVAGIPGPASPEANCPSQAASLSSAAYNQVCSVPLAGAQQYNIYESTSAGTEKLLATVNADDMVLAGANLVCYNDKSGGAAGANPVSADSTGGATFQGPVTVGGLTITGSNPVVAPALGIGGESAMTKNPRATFGGYLGATSNSSNIVFAQWSNTTPMKITTINAIALSAPVGCTTAPQFFVHDVAQNANTGTAVLANGTGSAYQGSVNFAVAAGDTLQLEYTAAGCTTQAQLINVTVEIEQQ